MINISISFSYLNGMALLEIVTCISEVWRGVDKELGGSRQLPLGMFQRLYDVSHMFCSVCVCVNVSGVAHLLQFRVPPHTDGCLSAELWRSPTFPVQGWACTPHILKIGCPWLMAEGPCLAHDDTSLLGQPAALQTPCSRIAGGSSEHQAAMAKSYPTHAFPGLFPGQPSRIPTCTSPPQTPQNTQSML